MKELNIYIQHKVEPRCVSKRGVLYIGNRNDSDLNYYWSPVDDLDKLSFITSDKYMNNILEVIR